MPNYRRVRQNGGTYFFTVVTAQRKPILRGDHVTLLLDVFADVSRDVPFDSEAFVVLPDHLHAIWRLPENDSDYSRRWGLIKTRFSKRSGLASPSGLGEYAGVWQPRFWEHFIRDDRDWRRHMNYIHYNPVRHGLVTRAIEWPHSSFHRWMEQGVYPPDWGVMDDSFDRSGFGE